MITEPLAKQKPLLARSEIGMFPADWPVNRLDRIAGGVSVGLVINPSTYISDHGTVPMLLGSQVTANKIDHEAARRITPQSNAKIPASILRAGDLVTVRVGDPGTTAVVANELDGCNCASMMIIRRGTCFNSLWLSHVMNSPLGRRQVANVQYGTAQKQFNIGDAVGFLFPVPPKAEQDAIAQALSDADVLIDSLEQLLTKKRQIKQGAMQELLTGKRRMSGLTGEWVTRELRQLGHVVRGVAYNPDADLADGDTEQTVRLLRSNNVQGGEIVRNGLQYVNRRRVRSDQYLQDGDLLLCMANGSRDLVGKAGRFVRADEHQYTFGAFMSCFRPDSLSVKSDYVAFIFQTHAFRQHVDLLLAGSSINNLRPEGVLGFTALIPTEPTEQVVLARALTEMDTELSTIESRLTKARALKQAMAQALLTGRIRLVGEGAVA